MLHLVCGRDPKYTYEKHRIIKIETIQGLGFTDRIIFHYGLTVNHLSFRSFCTDSYLHKKNFSLINLLCKNLTKFTSVLSRAIIKQAKNFTKGVIIIQ